MYTALQISTNFFTNVVVAVMLTTWFTSSTSNLSSANRLKLIEELKIWFHPLLILDKTFFNWNLDSNLIFGNSIVAETFFAKLEFVIVGNNWDTPFWMKEFISIKFINK